MRRSWSPVRACQPSAYRSLNNTPRAVASTVISRRWELTKRASDGGAGSGSRASSSRPISSASALEWNDAAWYGSPIPLQIDSPRPISPTTATTDGPAESNGRAQVRRPDADCTSHWLDPSYDGLANRLRSIPVVNGSTGSRHPHEIGRAHV